MSGGPETPERAEFGWFPRCKTGRCKSTNPQSSVTGAVPMLEPEACKSHVKMSRLACSAPTRTPVLSTAGCQLAGFAPTALEVPAVGRSPPGPCAIVLWLPRYHIIMPSSGPTPEDVEEPSDKVSRPHRERSPALPANALGLPPRVR